MMVLKGKEQLMPVFKHHFSTIKHRTQLYSKRYNFGVRLGGADCFVSRETGFASGFIENHRC
jgi:hypothetical protein